MVRIAWNRVGLGRFRSDVTDSNLDNLKWEKKLNYSYKENLSTFNSFYSSGVASVNRLHSFTLNRYNIN
jgi:hypothetical protein